MPRGQAVPWSEALRTIDLSPYRRNWLAQAEFSCDIGLPLRSGLSFFFYDAAEYRAFVQVAGPGQTVQADIERFIDKYAVLPRRWLKLHFEAGQRRGLSCYHVLTDFYPITTLRQAARRCGQPAVESLERALLPALERKDTTWAVIMKYDPEVLAPRMRISCRVSHGLAAQLLERLAQEGYAEQAPTLGVLHRDFAACRATYVTFEPGAPEVVALDYEGLSEGPRYLKCRLRQGRPAYSAYQALPQVMGEEALASLASAPLTLEAVEAAYEERHGDIVRSVSLTDQAALLPRGAGATTLELAARAGLAGAMRVLDAGCGAGGPALELARAFPEITLVGLTLSGQQAREARRQVARAGLQERISIDQGDFHALPYPSHRFDRVLFFESLRHAVDLGQAIRESCRVLKPGGQLLIKDAVVREGSLTAAERLELAEFQEIWAFRGWTAGHMREALLEAGLVLLSSADLGSEFGLAGFYGAMGLPEGPDFQWEPSQAWGAAHFRRYLSLPVLFHCLQAVKP